MIKGFLFGFGLLFGMAAFFILLIIVLKLIKKKTRNAPAKEWKKYLEQVLKAEDFAEAQFITSLITDKSDDDEIKTPPNYIIEAKSDFEIHESENGESSKIGFVKKYKIIKKNGIKQP